MEDDVFGSQQKSTSTSRLHFSFMEGRHRSSQRTHTPFTPPTRRGSPLNPQNANQTPELRRRPLPSDTSDSPSRSRRLNSGSIPRMARDSDLEEVGVFSNEYDLGASQARYGII